jgi:hypothetical protein
MTAIARKRETMVKVVFKMSRRTIALIVLVLAASTYATAQFRRQTRIPAMALATPDSFDGDWHFCRLAYQGRAWATDYPDADYNFSTRLSELTRAIVDRAGRILVLSTHNTDIADGWEREGVDPRYFFEFSKNSYAVGINILLYAMTH